MAGKRTTVLNFKADICAGEVVIVESAKVELWRSRPKWRGHFLFPSEAKIEKGKRYAIVTGERTRVVSVCTILMVGNLASATFEE